MLIQITAPANPRPTATATRRGLRVPLLTARVAGVLAVLVGVFTGTPVLAVAGVLLALAVPIFLVARVTQRTIRSTPLTTYEISDGGVASANVQARHSYAWNAFTHVDQLPGQLLFTRQTRVLPVPTAGLSPSQIDEVLGTAATNGLRVRRA